MRTPHLDTHHVVTEFGAANSQGLSSTERAKALIALAAPAFHDELVQAAKQLYLISMFVMINPERSPQDRRGVRASRAAGLLVNPGSMLPAGASPRPTDTIVIISVGFKSTYEALKPEMERQTVTRPVTVPVPQTLAPALNQATC